MRAFIEHAADALQMDLDPARFLVVDAARLKRTVFLYAPVSATPIAVVRMPVHWDTVKRCVAEHEGLQAFATLNLSAIQAPKPLTPFTWGEFECYTQQFISGRPWLLDLPVRDSLPKRSHVDTAVDLLIELHNASVSSEADEVSNTRCFQHRDFFLGNIGWRDKTAVLYDFEYARPKGYPLYDLLHFLLYYRIALRNRGLMRQNVAKGEYDAQQEERHFHLTAEDIQHTMVLPGGYRDVVARAVARYCIGCEIALDEAERLIVHSVEQAVENGRGVAGLSSDWQRALVNQLQQEMERTL